MTLFKAGTIKLHSGATSDWKIDCDALTDGDWGTLAMMAQPLLPDYAAVVSVPTGGDKFAEALRKYERPRGGWTLIADDVFTTGSSMDSCSKVMPPWVMHHGVVVFARGPCPAWVTPLFTFAGVR